MRSIFNFILFFSIATVLHAQQAKQYTFRHLSMMNGLASNVVGVTVQDEDGYIWIATVNGLQRYDGNNFITFRPDRKDPKAIPDNHIISMMFDQKKNFWLLGSNNHVGIFDTKKFIYTDIPVPGGYKGFYQPQGFIQLPTGEFLLTKIDGSIFQYDGNHKIFVRKDHFFPLPNGWKCKDVHWDSTSRKYWIRCDSGLVKYDPASKHLNYRSHNPDRDPAIENFKHLPPDFAVDFDKKGNLIVTSWPPFAGAPTIFRYDKAKNRLDSFCLATWLHIYHEIDGFLVEKNGRLWVYGNPFFAEWTDDEKDPFLFVPNEYRNEQSIKFDVAYHADEDREHNIWISTDNGIYIFNPGGQLFNSYNLVRTDGKPPAELNVTSIEEMKDGKIFVGTWGTGVFCYDQNFKALPLPKPMAEKAKYLSVWDMALNSKTNDLWLTLQYGSVAVYNHKEQFIQLTPEIFAGETIRQVDEDTSGNLWFGTQKGRVIKWDLKKSGNDPSRGYELVCQTGRVQKIHFDYKGYIWVGTVGSGLIKIDTRTNRIVRTFTSDGKDGESLYNNSPSDMTYYNDTTLIVSAGCLNIINTRTNKVSFISAENGLPSNTAECIQKDNKGTVWVGLTNGLCRLNIDKKIISYYDTRDGIAYDRFFTAGVNHLNDGRIVFFTDHNFLVFDPGKFGQQILPPKPFITSVRLSGQALSMDSLWNAKKLVLSYDQTSIAISFSALSYLQQRKVHYYYMLEGLDKDWIHVDHPIEAIYNSLPPGEFIFKVKSENSDGITSNEIASIPITVRPPIWQTWWFYSLIALMLIAILYLMDRERIKRRNSLQQVRRQIRANLRDEVSTTLNNINVLSEIAKIKADKNVEQAKNFIDQISEKSSHMMEALDDTLWGIDPANDSVKKFILRIRELTEGLKASYDVDIDLIVDNKVQSLELDMKLRHELFFFYKEAMKFIVSKIACRQTFVNLSKVRSKLMIEILSECGSATTDFKNQFKNTVQKRVDAMPSTMDLLQDTRSFSVVLYVELAGGRGG